MASTDTIPTRREVQKIQPSWFNLIKEALSSSFLPRNTSGVATDLGGSLGTVSLRWLFLRISSGHWVAGDIQALHPYNGEMEPGEGWMLCDGRVINEANYDTEHGAGHWDTFIVSSVLDGKRLPNLAGKYPVGKDATTQNGSVAITGVGNTSHQVNLRHFHRWLFAENAATPDGIWTTGGSFDSVNGGTSPTNVIAVGSAALQMPDAFTDPQLSATQSIQPDSIEVQFYMRVFTP